MKKDLNQKGELRKTPKWYIKYDHEDKKWMLMTYYCPTHGDAGKVEPIQVTRQEIYSKLYDKTKSKKEIK